MRAAPLHLLALVAAATASSPATAQAPPAGAASSDAVPLDADPPGTEKTKTPSFDEWSKARKVRLTRTGPAAAPCTAYRVREWLKVRCMGTRPHAMVVLGGDAAEVSFWIDHDERRGGEVQFPLRRGDRRVVQIWTGEADEAGVFKPRPALVIQEHWLEDRAAPTVTAM
ncbi:hypothetical protein [Polyangium aurulentum]|uniref:hypothetical protein n=1 Tax=Polyangium aurulentum TaxID=2567896 RepID=UPI0010ADA9ED|nr:hypothetical protein [Polyangium aurulentum]UQA55781.1 hypothetical protein E8A73_031175 [Polyangium aurulentum]